MVCIWFDFATQPINCIFIFRLMRLILNYTEFHCLFLGVKFPNNEILFNAKRKRHLRNEKGNRTRNYSSMSHALAWYYTH